LTTLLGPEGGDIAGKTGTAEVTGARSHAWFVGFAPASQKEGRRIAFAVLIENGGYGGAAAVPLAGEIVTGARALGIIK
jgi:peptidoglycan glycosyltransferase